jgi:hypothetical protein
MYTNPLEAMLEAAPEGSEATPATMLVTIPTIEIATNAFRKATRFIESNFMIPLICYSIDVWYCTALRIRRMTERMLEQKYHIM